MVFRLHRGIFGERPRNQIVGADAIYLATVWALPVIIAITFHEAVHGFVAHLLGDDTAWRLGRVSFNPLKHVDPFGTILLPGILLLLRSPFIFGYAKPVGNPIELLFLGEFRDIDARLQAARLACACQRRHVRCSTSKSANRTLRPEQASATAVDRASVDFPTPPFCEVKRM
jgi:hypothetical protein